ncbi:TPA: ABC transporter permease [Enterobacter kobei]|nr:ABC transporter permease [Enterobacter kobei]
MNVVKQFFVRTTTILVKEVAELKRDRISLLMIFIMPLINLFIIGFSVNTDPKFVRTALIDYDHSVFSRSLIMGMKNTHYFSFQYFNDEKKVDLLFKKGDVQFVVIIPAGFSQDLISEKKPQVLVQYDATDPGVTANAISALTALMNTVFNKDIKNIDSLQKYNLSLVDIVFHKLYNPEGITKLNVVPGLIGVILSIILVLMTSLSIIRERENGSIVHIINAPVRHYEIMLGKMLPYFIIGGLQAVMIITGAVCILNVPIIGSIISLFVLLFVFIVLCVSVGVIFSSVTKSQLQVMQLASFYFLLSTILSGFMVPFLGMPTWSQIIGSLLPLTYFLRLSRGIMVKGYSLNDMMPDFISLTSLMVLLLIVSFIVFRRITKS